MTKQPSEGTIVGPLTRALTPEQEKARKETDERNARISKGIKAPESGAFGLPPKEGKN